MDTGMTNLGEGGEAKASLADEDPIIDVPGDEPIDTTPVDGDIDEHEGTIDAALGANMDPTLPPEPEPPHIGYGETAAYGETIENDPMPG
jgi:hypothetical protein